MLSVSYILFDMIIEQVVSGIVQGIAEWLPISSEGALILVKTTFFNTGQDVTSLIKDALFLHLGTVLAAIIYFWKDILRYAVSLVSWRTAPTEDKNVIKFLVIATLVSGGIGYVLIRYVATINVLSPATSTGIIIFIGILLLMTGALQFIKPSYTHQSNITLGTKDSLILGVVQGFAALPGLSRSGLTVAALLLRNYSKETALHLSFLMSIPIVIAGNIVFAIGETEFKPVSLVGLAVACITGYLTIDLLLRVARKINFGYFVIGFGILTIIAALV